MASLWNHLIDCCKLVMVSSLLSSPAAFYALLLRNWSSFLTFDMCPFKRRVNPKGTYSVGGHEVIFMVIEDSPKLILYVFNAHF